MAGIHIRCYGQYLNDRTCDLCKMVNSDIAHSCEIDSKNKPICPDNWKKCEQMQVSNCLHCTEQKTPQTCKRRIRLLDEGVHNNELRITRVEGSTGYEVLQ